MTDDRATLVALSATHRTAGLDDRAAFAVPPAGVEAFYAAAREGGLAEAVLLATCNRLEAYAVGDEAAALTGQSEPHEALRALTERDLLVVVKRGPDGAVVGSGEQRWSAPAAPAENRDTTGAGDAFAAGFLASWTRGADIEEALRLATRVAARAVSLQGGRP